MLPEFIQELYDFTWEWWAEERGWEFDPGDWFHCWPRPYWLTAASHYCNC